jgi:hypothetical protein
MARTTESFDRSVEALGHRYRRRLLIALLDHNPQDDEDAQDSEEALGSVVDGEVDQQLVQSELVHNHLPKLDELGYITWNPETGKIKKGPQWEEIAPLLALLKDHDDELPEGWL